MHVNVKGTLVKAATKRAKYDKDGQEVEGAAISLTIDLPIVDLTGGDLAGILRAVERKLDVDLDDGQASFDVVGDRLEVTAGARR
jgi:hypothetical protein